MSGFDSSPGCLRTIPSRWGNWSIIEDGYQLTDKDIRRMWDEYQLTFHFFKEFNPDDECHDLAFGHYKYATVADWVAKCGCWFTPGGLWRACDGSRPKIPIPRPVPGTPVWKLPGTAIGHSMLHALRVYLCAPQHSRDRRYTQTSDPIKQTNTHKLILSLRFKALYEATEWQRHGYDIAQYWNIDPDFFTGQAVTKQARSYGKSAFVFHLAALDLYFGVRWRCAFDVTSQLRPGDTLLSLITTYNRLPRASTRLVSVQLNQVVVRDYEGGLSMCTFYPQTAIPFSLPRTALPNV
jgi:hypothetical protein